MRNGLPSLFGAVLYGLPPLLGLTTMDRGTLLLLLLLLLLLPTNPLCLHALQSHDLATEDMVKHRHAFGERTM